MLIYFVVILVRFVVKKPDRWNWLMGAMVVVPWVLRIFFIK
ncbi:MAG: hypothetical protein PWP37_1594 [Thermotogota bacterium]|jgi:hypothetical protein|nr:hypothetical protein [Thermotogota bacterium]